jgi:eukaryotic-like serine/threonine-protein kinase
MKAGFLRKYNANTFGGFLLHLVLAVILLIVLCVLYFYAYLPGTTNHGETITVPNVEGLPLERVAEFLEEHDLRYEINDSSYSEDYPPLTVLKQVPVSGSKVKENRKIYVTVNRLKPPTVPVPDLIDVSLINADALLKGSELRRGKIHLVRGPFLNLVKEIQIGGKTVMPGVRIPKGTIIDLVVMDGGSKNLPAPNVVGMSLEDAKIPLLGSNLSIGEIHLLGDTTGGKAVILKQNPPPQENIQVGDVVELWIGEPGSDVDDNDGTSDDNEDGER